MVAPLVYRTDDFTRWGGGQGSDLSAETIDIDFYTLWSAITALEDHQDTQAGIDFISQPVNGNQFFIHLTDHRVLGPIIIPTSQWNPRGDWAPTTGYSAFDTVGNNGQLYLVAIPHTSAATFSPFATDGLGHLLYILILSAPDNALPEGGTVGQRLAKSSGSPYKTRWESDRIRMFVFIQGQPLPGELLMQYPVSDPMVIPAGLANSVIFDNTRAATNTSYTLNKNGAPIGSITFSPSPDVIVTFGSDVLCNPGDLITLVGPSTPDVQQSDISFTLVALLAE